MPTSTCHPLSFEPRPFPSYPPPHAFTDPKVLSFFKPGKSLGDILACERDIPPKSKLVFLHMLVWLLQVLHPADLYVV